MGDMAEYTLQQVFEFEELRKKFLSGEMDIHDAIDCGVCDEHGTYIDDKNNEEHDFSCFDIDDV